MCVEGTKTADWANKMTVAAWGFRILSLRSKRLAPFTRSASLARIAAGIHRTSSRPCPSHLIYYSVVAPVKDFPMTFRQRTSSSYLVRRVSSTSPAKCFTSRHSSYDGPNSLHMVIQYSASVTFSSSFANEFPMSLFHFPFPFIVMRICLHIGYNYHSVF